MNNDHNNEDKHDEIDFEQIKRSIQKKVNLINSYNPKRLVGFQGLKSEVSDETSSPKVDVEVSDETSIPQVDVEVADEISSPKVDVEVADSQEITNKTHGFYLTETGIVNKLENKDLNKS